MDKVVMRLLVREQVGLIERLCEVREAVSQG